MVPLLLTPPWMFPSVSIGSYILEQMQVFCKYCISIWGQTGAGCNGEDFNIYKTSVLQMSYLIVLSNLWFWNVGLWQWFELNLTFAMVENYLISNNTVLHFYQLIACFYEKKNLKILKCNFGATWSHTNCCEVRKYNICLCNLVYLLYWVKNEVEILKARMAQTCAGQCLSQCIRLLHCLIAKHWFIRTPTWLHEIPLFYGVDIIVYVCIH